MAVGDKTHVGRCQCGAVGIEADGDPIWTGTCHCASCRKATGAAAAAYAGYDRTKTEVTGDNFVEFESSPGTFRGFCSRCGSRLTYRSETLYPTELHFHVGAFDDADFFAPQANANVREKLAWVQLEKELPAFQTVPSAEGS